MSVAEPIYVPRETMGVRTSKHLGPHLKPASANLLSKILGSALTRRIKPVWCVQPYLLSAVASDMD